jgi:hypothetical protein
MPEAPGTRPEPDSGQRPNEDRPGRDDSARPWPTPPEAQTPPGWPTPPVIAVLSGSPLRQRMHMITVGAVAVAAAVLAAVVAILLTGGPAGSSAPAARPASSPAAGIPAPVTTQPGGQDSGADLHLFVGGRVTAVSGTSITISGEGHTITAQITGSTAFTGVSGATGIKVGDLVTAQIAGYGSRPVVTAIQDPAQLP